MWLVIMPQALVKNLHIVPITTLDLGKIYFNLDGRKHLYGDSLLSQLGQ